MRDVLVAALATLVRKGRRPRPCVSEEQWLAVGVRRGHVIKEPSVRRRLLPGDTDQGLCAADDGGIGVLIKPAQDRQPLLRSELGHLGQLRVVKCLRDEQALGIGRGELELLVEVAHAPG